MERQMDRNIWTLSFVTLLLNTALFAQQTPSPLEASFRTYKEMKKATPYKLDWVSLGPMVNSARADVVQVDATKGLFGVQVMNGRRLFLR
jgi:hypothetical protein